MSRIAKSLHLSLSCAIMYDYHIGDGPRNVRVLENIRFFHFIVKDEREGLSSKEKACQVKIVEELLAFLVLYKIMKGLTQQ